MGLHFPQSSYRLLILKVFFISNIFAGLTLHEKSLWSSILIHLYYYVYIKLIIVHIIKRIKNFKLDLDRLSHLSTTWDKLDLDLFSDFSTTLDKLDLDLLSDLSTTWDKLDLDLLSDLSTTWDTLDLDILL